MIKERLEKVSDAVNGDSNSIFHYFGALVTGERAGETLKRPWEVADWVIKMVPTNQTTLAAVEEVEEEGNEAKRRRMNTG